MATSYRPQAGPQETFLSTPADIAIFGGAAGGGKTFALLMESLRHIDNQNYGAVIFRRTSPQIRNEGGLWDESEKLYRPPGEPKETMLEWSFPSGAKIKFSHMEHGKNIHDWDGAQIPLLAFDQLEQFTKKQFFYLLSRNRSTSGVTPYVRATANPQPNWLADFLDWWINDEGYAIEDRSGAVRYMIRRNEEIKWADDAADLVYEYDDVIAEEVKSVTFVHADVYDNPALLDKDPTYVSNLKSLSRVDRERLLHGNWKIRAEAGEVFKRDWFQYVDHAPKGKEWVRYWDAGATAGGGDYSSGVLMVKKNDDTFTIGNIRTGQWSTGERDRIIKNTARSDLKKYGPHGTCVREQEPGSAGKDSIHHLVRMLSDLPIKAEGDKVTGSKGDRAKPLSSAMEQGMIEVASAPWNERFEDQMVLFDPENDSHDHDDMVDGATGAYRWLVRDEDSSEFFFA